jgi:hypothetical protein
LSTPDPEHQRPSPPRAARRPPLGERLHGPDSYGLLLLLIALSLLLTALVGEQRWGRVIITAISGGTTLFAYWTSRPHARVLRWVVIGVAVAVVGASVGVLAGSGTVLDGASQTTIALLTAASPVVVGRRLLRHPRVQGSTILGALCIYLLFGLFFAYLYSAIGAISGPFFADQPQASIVDCLYFSYASLTTVGYGDLVAAQDLGRMLAISEALIGQLYLVTVVALLVGNIGRDRIRPDRG